MFGITVGDPLIPTATAVLVLGAMWASTILCTRHVSDLTFARFLRE